MGCRPSCGPCQSKLLPTGVPTLAELESIVAKCERCGGPPSPANIERILRAYFDMFETGDTSAVDVILTEDVTFLGPFDTPPGRDTARFIVELNRATVPDLTVSVEDIVVCGNKAAIGYAFIGTISGELPFFCLEPEGQPFFELGIDLVTFRGCQISGFVHASNTLSTLLNAIFSTDPPGECCLNEESVGLMRAGARTSARLTRTGASRGATRIAEARRSLAGLKNLGGLLSKQSTRTMALGPGKPRGAKSKRKK